MPPSPLVECERHLRRPDVVAELQAGQGAPGAPQPQALSPSRGRSRWRLRTHPLSLQKSHFMCFATGRLGESPEKEPLMYLSGPHSQFENFFVIKRPRWANQNLSQSTALWSP
jgi:hypothetical protein